MEVENLIYKRWGWGDDVWGHLRSTSIFLMGGGGGSTIKLDAIFLW